MSQPAPSTADEDLPVPQSRTDFLWTIARVRGLQPADVATARVLELGCGAGANLIPQAERHPDSTFLGIDESPQRVAGGVALTAAIGLKNIDFRADVPLNVVDGEPFDYILVSGLYSRLNAAGRDKLLTSCRQMLAPQGVLFVDYDVYPGCHVHDVLRSMMAYEARRATSAEQRLAESRKLLQFLQSSLPQNDPYSELLLSEVDPLLNRTDAWLGRHVLAAGNAPVYFRQFVEHARSQELQFLGDGTVGLRYTDPMSAEIEGGLDAVTKDPLEREQLRDVLRNKSRRQSLLCHGGIAVQQTLTVAQLAGLYLEALLRPDDPEARIHSTKLDRFVATRGSTVSTTAPLIKSALSQLTASWPDSIRFEDLATEAWTDLAPLLRLAETISPAETQRLHDNILQCCAEGIVHVHGTPPQFATQISDHPTASPLARWQAARGNVATNRRHESVPLVYFDWHVIQLLDGTRNIAKLLDYLSASALVGKLIVLEGEQQVQDADRLRAILEEALPDSLARLAQNAFLIH